MIVSSLLKIWTMWRSDCESRILNTYVPAGKTPHPARCTPGISTGPLKAITVFRFQSSALAPGASTALTSAVKHIVVATLNSFISFSFAPDSAVCCSLRRETDPAGLARALDPCMLRAESFFGRLYQRIAEHSQQRSKAR